MPMDSWSDYYNRRMTHHQTTYLEEQYLYDHLLACVQTESPEALLARFRMLFINGSYSDHAVWQCLKKMVELPFIEQDFKFILNHSCHIFINHWLMQPQLHAAIPELVALLHSAGTGSPRSRTTQRLRELVQRFGGSEQYLALRRLAQVVGQTPESLADRHKPLGTLIRRYPYLYKYSLLTPDSTDEQYRRLRQIRRQVQRQFERELSQYATHKLLSDSLNPQSRSRSFKNPTLLSDRQLNRALHQFGGKIDGSNTCRDLAQRFLTYSSHPGSYRDFKGDLYDYLTCSIEPKYGSSQFNQRLYQQLQAILPEHDEDQLNDVLLIGTCRKLLNLLVVESPQQPNHAILVDLTGNLGTPTTIGLLLKIVLICRKVKPYLEKQFSILFKHYEDCARDSVIWLIDSLETLNVAFSINFGSLSL